MSRYYATLKRDDNYKRRVSRLELPSNNQLSYAIVEYIGKYPEEIASHGKSKHQDTMYTRTNTEILEKISSMNDGRTPRDLYKAMVLDDSINCPRDFKQVRNIKYQKTKKGKDVNNGKRNNLADEVLECISLVDTHLSVQHCSKAKGRIHGRSTQGFGILSLMEK